MCKKSLKMPRGNPNPSIKQTIEQNKDKRTYGDLHEETLHRKLIQCIGLHQHTSKNRGWSSGAPEV